MTKRIDDNLSSLADEYGKVKAELARLNKRQKQIKAIFEDAAVHELEGELFRVVVSDVPESTGPDWVKIAMKLGATERMVEHPANQVVTRAAHQRISVYGRTGEEDS